MSRNITLSIDDAVLEKVRMLAAENKTTVNAMVREFLERKAGESEAARTRVEAAARLLERSRNAAGKLPDNWRFDREDVYAERLSGHQHSDLRGGGAKERS